MLVLEVGLILMFPLIAVFSLGLIAKVYLFLFELPGDQERYHRLIKSFETGSPLKKKELDPTSEEYFSKYMPKA